MNQTPTIEVIVPTLANSARGHSLIRAIDSIVFQQDVNARPLIVINGTQFCEKLVSYLKRREDIRVLIEPTAGLPLAREIGRNNVSAPFFSFLDDDDIYLPNTLAKRIAPFLSDESLAVVISNGQRLSRDGATTIVYTDRCFEPSDPLGSLINKNWLASCGGTFRATLVEPEIFSQVARYHEWTMIAWRLSISRKKIFYLPDLTFEIHETESSLSHSSPYIRYAPVGLELMLSYEIPSTQRKKLKRKLSHALHAVAELDFKEGYRLKAFRSHFSSMKTLYGFRRYAFFTRKLLFWRKKT